MNLKEYQGLSVEISPEDEVFSCQRSSIGALSSVGLESLERMLPLYNESENSKWDIY
ncbi:hypothetical protein [Methanosarcina mazei]|uniref:hypothetical protein n=1 Tax=Methanosarcina mazei TaxID=2209 RepID=UPI000B2B0E43|nr:hypothetical protein [Methanosarcina mazei]